jgi:ACS family glucarate transporter-like MFS transporter
MRNYTWYLWIGVVFPLTFFMAMDRVNMAVAAGIIQKTYHFSLLEITVILTSFTIFYAFLQVPMAMLVERWGPRKGLGFASAWWSIFTILTPFGGFYYGFVAIRSLLGVGQAADWPASVTAINTYFKKEQRSQGNSILLGGLYLGSVIGAVITGYISSTIGWQWSFYIFGLLGLVTSLLWWKFFRDNPKSNKYLSEEDRNILLAQKDSTAEKTHAVQWKHFFKSLRFWGFGVQYLLLIMVQSFYTTLLPIYLYTYRHISIATVGKLTALPFAALFVAVFVIGYLQKRTLVKTKSVYRARVPYAVAGFAIAAAFLYLAMSVSNVYYAVYLMMISMVGVGLVQVTIWSASQDLGQKHTAPVSGWVNMWGNAGAAFGPLFTAVLVTLGKSFTTAVAAVGLSALGGIVIWLFLKPQVPLVPLEEQNATVKPPT